jgi:hypothetical protein
MGSLESEIAQSCPHTYLEYMGGMDYSDDDMEGGDELSPVELEMETEEVLMTSVQVDNEYFDFFGFIIGSEFFLCRYGCIYTSIDAGLDYRHNCHRFQLFHGLE